MRLDRVVAVVRSVRLAGRVFAVVWVGRGWLAGRVYAVVWVGREWVAGLVFALVWVGRSVRSGGSRCLALGKGREEVGAAVG
ncbi:hypothetical protein Ait01nite_077750 [Actinoplanes italicus]|uniref:Uncharacterized protein n=1 Tax=Actinoplanes italicus TaxID=113567 RepID=A0A2T0K3X6_9ACTN|nr:hypothetical protein CLV67_11577 [Actinoplanes italicus]GIE34730.1 hypothetical protein Ait01nite_077750 [Actinoplanes italicus]